MKRISRATVGVTSMTLREARRGDGAALARMLEAAEQWGRAQGATLSVGDTYIAGPVPVPFGEERMGYRAARSSFANA